MGEKGLAVEVGSKVMLIMFFDHWTPLYRHFVPLKITFNKEYYLEVLKNIWQHVNWKHLELKSQ